LSRPHQPVAHPAEDARPRVSLLVAMARNRVIGAQGRLPWHIPADLKRFKALTMGHHIVMGRKTFESIGRLLPGRTTVILTRQPAYRVPGAIVVRSLDEALEECHGDDEIFVIGGGELYREALPRADRIYLTEVDGEFAGDTYFPQLDRNQWQERDSEVLSDEAPRAVLRVLDRR